MEPSTPIQEPQEEILIEEKTVPPELEPAPSVPSSTIWSRETLKNKRVLMGVGGVVVLVLLIVGGALAYSRQNQSDSVSPSPSPTFASPTPSPSSTPSSSPKATASAQPKKIVPTPSPSVVPSPTPQAPTPSPTPSPSHTPNPPVMRINYPSEGQAISMSAGESFCVVDIPQGGDHSGLQSRVSINNQSWTNYVNHNTLCFVPAEGQNTFSMQYRNQYGDESPQYTRNFTFQWE